MTPKQALIVFCDRPVELVWIAPQGGVLARQVVAYDGPPPPPAPSPVERLPGTLLPHAQPGEIRSGEMHWRGGWYFSRMHEKSVHICVRVGFVDQHAMIPRAEWDSIVEHVAPEERTPDDSSE